MNRWKKNAEQSRAWVEVQSCGRGERGRVLSVIRGRLNVQFWCCLSIIWPCDDGDGRFSVFGGWSTWLRRPAAAAGRLCMTVPPRPTCCWCEVWLPGCCGSPRPAKITTSFAMIIKSIMPTRRPNNTEVQPDYRCWMVRGCIWK